MIRVFRLDGTELLLNADLIARVEQDETTVIVLADGERIPVKNPPIDIHVKGIARRLGMEEENQRFDHLELGEEAEAAAEAEVQKPRESRPGQEKRPETERPAGDRSRPFRRRPVKKFSSFRKPRTPTRGRS